MSAPINTFLQFKAYPTGRPAFVDPWRVGGIADLLDVQPPRIQGADPTFTVVGATVIVDGSPMNLSEDPVVVRAAIEEYRKRATATSSVKLN